MNASLKESGGPFAAPPNGSLAGLALSQWPGDVALLRPDLRVEWINERFAARIGLEAAECIGLDWLALHPTAAVHAAEYQRAARGEGIELPPFPANGPERLGFFAATLQPLRQDGQVAGLLVTEHDVSIPALSAQADERRDAMLRLLTEASRDAVALLDAGGRMTFISDSVLEVTGRPAQDYLGRNIFEFIHADDLDEVRSKMASGDVLRTPLRMRRVRYRFRHGDGSWHWMESLAVNALHDPLLESILVHSRDVTHDVALEDTLRRRERRFRALTEKSDDVVVVLGADGNAVFESASVERIFGFRPRELTSRRILRLVHPSQRRQVISVVRPLVGHEEAERRLEFMIRDAAGGHRWIEAVLVDLIEDPDVNGLLINARDVTARKVAEAERDGALQDSSVIVWEYDLATRRTLWRSDPESLRRVGIAAGRDDHSWLERVHPDDLPQVRESHELLASGARSSLDVEYRLRDFAGEWRRVLVRGQLAGHGARGPVARGVFIDVTERRRIEDDLARTREQFRLAIEFAQIGFYEWDLQADTLAGLDEWCERRGVPPERGRPGHDRRWETLVHPEDVGALRRSFEDHLRGLSEVAEIEYRMRTHDGRWIWVFDRGQVTERLPDGRPRRVVGVCMEIDRRRRAEAALHETEARLSATVWGAGIGMWEMDLQGNGARWFNDWCEQEDLHACEGPDHVQSWDAHIHPDDLPRAAQLFSDLTEGRREVYESEYRIRTRAGRWTWIFERSRATERGVDGRPRRIVGICMNVQARKEAERALRKSEFLYRTVAEFTPGFVCELSIQPSGTMQVLWASDGFETFFGAAPVRFHALGLATFFGAEEIALGQNLVRRLCRGEQVSETLQARNLDGSLRWLQLTLRPFFDLATGTATAAIGLAHDITERKRAEDALHESQLRLRAIAENSTDWLLLVDPQQRIVFCNRPVQGRSPEQLAGRSVWEFAPAHDQDGARQFIDGVLAGRDPHPQREQVLEDGLGGPRVLLLRAQPVFAAESIVGVVMTITEITRQRRDEQMLRLQARILETMREGVVLVDARNTIRLTNPAFDELFGYGQGELAGRSVADLFRLDVTTLPGAERRLRAQLVSARVEPAEFECLRRDGSVFAAACVVTPLVIDGADHWLAVLNDVSERKLLERQILEVSNREQQRIGNDLHDGLGQELTGVALMLRGLTTRIRRAHPDALGEVDEIVALLNQSIYNARTLARGLSPVSLERGGLVPALRTLAARARETYGLATTLRTRLSHPLRLDENAASHLYRIVQEALSNAMRHGRATRVRIQLSTDDVAIRLSVHDNGRGLPPDSQIAVGLGLRTMRYRAQVVGGDLLVTNHRLGGTIVRCVCPQGAREALSLAHAHARAHARAHSQPTWRRAPNSGEDRD
ncbi:MAG: PAS domain S-box protein [Steroidobacteraceae bacterium]